MSYCYLKYMHWEYVNHYPLSLFLGKFRKSAKEQEEKQCNTSVKRKKGRKENNG